MSKNNVVVSRLVSRDSGRKFPLALFDVPQSFRDSSGMAGMSEDARNAAVKYVYDAMAQAGMDEVALLVTAKVDAGTLRTFLRGDTWPQTPSRTKIENALGLPVGSMVLAARGQLDENIGDAVERAIDASGLTRSNKLRLKAAYVDMLEEQERGAS